MQNFKRYPNNNKRITVINARWRDYMLTVLDQQVPFPMGVNVRTRPGKTRTVTHEESYVGSPPSFGDEEHSYNGETSAGSRSAKESD